MTDWLVIFVGAADAMGAEQPRTNIAHSRPRDDAMTRSARSRHIGRLLASTRQNARTRPTLARIYIGPLPLDENRRSLLEPSSAGAVCDGVDARD